MSSHTYIAGRLALSALTTLTGGLLLLLLLRPART